MNKNKRVMGDERDSQNFGEASQWALWSVILFTIGKVIYYLHFSAVEDLGFLVWDGILLLIVAVALVIVTRKRKTYHLPRTLFGKKSIIGQNKKARKKRILASYLPKAILFALGMTVGSILASGYTDFDVSIVETLIYFVVAFILNYLWGEFNVKGYNEAFEQE
jgi:uncharacterized protein YacL